MPIVVQHQPSALGIGAVAFQAGLGQYRARQEEMDLKRQQQAMQWAQMALQNQASLRNDMLQAQQMQDANQRFLMGREQQAEQFNAQLGQQAQQFGVNQKAQDQWRADQQKMEADRLENQRRLQEAGFEFRNADWERQQAWEAGAGERKVKEFEMMDAARLSAEGARAQKDLNQQLENIETARRRPNSGMTDELAEQARQRVRDKFVGLDMNRMLIENGSPEEAAAAKRAELEQSWSASVMERPDGTMWQKKSRNGVDSWEQIGVKIPANQQLASKEHLALNQLYTKEATEHFRKGGEVDPVTGNELPVAPFPSFEDWKRGRQMNPGGEGEPPIAAPPAVTAPQAGPANTPQASPQDIALKAQQFAAQAPPEVQQAVSFLSQVTQQFPPGTELEMPPDVWRKIEQAKQIIQAHKSQPSQPMAPAGGGLPGNNVVPQQPPRPQQAIQQEIIPAANEGVTFEEFASVPNRNPEYIQIVKRAMQFLQDRADKGGRWFRTDAQDEEQSEFYRKILKDAGVKFTPTKSNARPQPSAPKRGRFLSKEWSPMGEVQ